MRIIIKILRRILHDIAMIFAPPFLRKKLMSCREVSEILATNPDLSQSKRRYLKMHLLICQCCTNYSEELRIINETAKKMSPPKLSLEQQQKLDQSRQNTIQKMTRKP